MKIKLGIFTSILLIIFAGYANASGPKEGWYPKLAKYSEVSKYAVLPMPPGAAIVDSRPAGRKYNKGHIPGAVSIPDRKFDKMTNKLPENKSDLLIFYCGGLKCMLSHKSAFKAEKLGYTNIKVYADGFPDWKKNGGLVGVTVSHLKKLIDKNANMVVIDSRPKKRKYDKGHIPGAISIPDRMFAKMTDKLPADKSTPLYFYCGGLKCKLSPNSAKKAIELGYKKVKIIPAGYPAWKKAYGKKKIKKAIKIKEGSDSGSMAVTSFKKIYKKTPEALLIIDVRDPEEFKQGAFKGAINIPMNDLEKRMEGIKDDKPIVFFCGAGGRAGEAYDMVQMFRPKLKTYFLNAETTIHADGNYTMTELEE